MACIEVKMPEDAVALSGLAQMVRQLVPEDRGFYIVTFDMVGDVFQAIGDGTRRKAIIALRKTADEIQARRTTP